MIRPLFISYFTLGTPYEREVRELEVTLRRFELDYLIVPLPSLDDWRRNTAQKPRVVRDVMLKNEGRPIVWLDADARVEQVPSLFDTLDCDVAAHYFHGHELLSSTVYFGATPGAWALVRRWQEIVDSRPGEWDQTPLQEAIEELRDRLAVVRLPQSYAAIFDAKGSENPVILQTQASRRHKHVIGRTN